MQTNFHSVKTVLFIPVLLLFIGSCRKIDVTNPDVIPDTKQLNEKFFTLPAGIDPEVIEVANNLQKQKPFINNLTKFIQKNGLPKWDKTVFKVSGKQDINYRGSFDSSSSKGLFLIPLKSTSSDKIQSYITAYKHNDSLYTYRLYNKDSLDNVHPASDTSKKALLNAQAVFGYFEKTINDKNSISVNSPSNGKIKNVRIGFGTGNRNARNSSSFSMTCEMTVTLTVYYEWQDTSTSWAPSEGWVEVAWELDITITCTGVSGGDCGCGAGSGGGYDDPNYYWWNYGTGWPYNNNYTDPYYDPNWYYWWTGASYYDPYANYILTDDDNRVINEIAQEDNAADASLGNPCHTTNRFGNVRFPGTLEHWLIQLDYLHRYSGGVEYLIPNSGPNGGNGYADIANESTHEIFEIKPNTATGRASGQAEVANYVSKANQYCGNGTWSAGTNYSGTVMFYPTDPTKVLKTQLYSNGVIVYEYPDATSNPLPFSVPKTVTDKIKDLIKRLIQNASNIEQQILIYLRLNPDVVTYIKNAAIGAAVVIVVGTIVEDFLTAGAGIWDDWACFTLAYKLVRIAIKL